MATMTISYDARNRKARKAVNDLLDTGIFTTDRKPNKLTMAAIEEAKRGKYAGMADTSSVEAFLKSVLG